MKILLIGGSGMLGAELRKLNHELICPSHDVIDISVSILGFSRNYLDDFLHGVDVVINAAAVKDNRTIELDPIEALHTNIIGAAAVAITCYERNLRYVYISTDYIYKGDRGNYKETDEILPANIYAWTKLGGECSARAVKNHLIIRTSFGPSQFEYKQAFSDKWTSKDYVDVIAPMILEAAISPLTGTLNLATERKTLFGHASKRNSDVKPVRLGDSSFTTPYDTSFNLQKWQDYKSLKPLAKPHTNCRVCGSDKLTKYLDLGLMPLANNLEFTSISAKQTDRFPLQVMFCESCGLSQLSVVIDPEKMYSYYTYRSGVNLPYAQHCKGMAESIFHEYTTPKFHIDIAGNDGTLLNEFKRLTPHEVYNCLNVDPATNLTAIAEANGIPSMTEFWSYQTSEKVKQKYGEADLITATNVFAHVDNIEQFLLGCINALKSDGIIVIECPYIVDFIENMEFDTVYFEHLSYMSIIPVHQICSRLGLKIIDISKQNIHGGTVRIIIAMDHSEHQVKDSVFEFVNNENERGFNKIQVYQNWTHKVKNAVHVFGKVMMEMKREGKRIACFAASAKGNTLLNAAGLNTEVIDYIVDETPEKIGKYSPGTGIPIVNKHELVKRPVDYVIILSWNFAESIIPKIKELTDAKIIIPIPEIKIL